MKKFKWLIVTALLLVLVLSLALVGCGSKGEKLTKEEWDSAFVVENFENVTIKGTAKTETENEGFLFKIEKDKVYMRTTTDGSSYESGVNGVLSGKFEAYSCKEDDIVYTYHKMNAGWIRKKTSYSDINIDTPVDGMKMFKDLYDELEYNEKTGAYEGTNIYFASEKLEKLEIKMSNGKLVSMKMCYQEDANSHYSEETMTCTNYGSTKVRLPKRNEKLEKEMTARNDAGNFGYYIREAWNREDDVIDVKYDETTGEITYIKQDMFNDNKVGNDKLIQFLKEKTYFKPQDGVAYVFIDEDYYEGTIFIPNDEKCAGVHGNIYPVKTPVGEERKAITIESKFEEIENVCQTATFKIIVKNGEYIIA